MSRYGSNGLIADALSVGVILDKESRKKVASIFYRDGRNLELFDKDDQTVQQHYMEWSMKE